MIINKGVLHILDFYSGVTVFSEQELEIKSDSVITFLVKHLEKAYQDANGKTGVFHPESGCKMLVERYMDGSLDFVAFSAALAERMYEMIAQAETQDPADLLIVDCVMEEKRLIGILKCNNQMGYTHQVVQEDSRVRNEIINHHAILPALSQKISEYAFIEIPAMELRFADKKRSINGEDVYILPDKVLECTAGVSPNHAIKMVHTIAKKVAENNGQSSVEAVSRAKTCMVEKAEFSDYLDPAAIGREVFSTSPAMQEEYMEEARKAGLEESVKVDRELCVRKGRQHKIKTDTGIEISFPADYFGNEEFMEFVNHPNGTISIQLKNIGKITNR